MWLKAKRPRQCSGRELDEQSTSGLAEHERKPRSTVTNGNNRGKSILHQRNGTKFYTGLGIHPAESAFLESISKFVSWPTLIKTLRIEFFKNKTDGSKEGKKTCFPWVQSAFSTMQPMSSNALGLDVQMTESSNANASSSKYCHIPSRIFIIDLGLK